MTTLRTLAEAANRPEWSVLVTTFGEDRAGAFVAACSPSVVLALLDRAEAAERELAEREADKSVIRTQAASIRQLQERLLSFQGDAPDFASAARPLIRWMNSVHPHHTAIVTSTDAELVEGKQVFRTEEYLRDKAPAPVAPAPSLAELDRLAAAYFDACNGDSFGVAGEASARHGEACRRAGVNEYAHYRDWQRNRRERVGGSDV